MDVGLLGGIAAGLQGAVEGYQQGQALKMQRQQRDLQMSQAGFTTDENGNVIPNTNRQAQMDYEMQSMNPNSQLSQDRRNLGRGLLKASNPMLKDEDLEKYIPDTMSGMEIDKSGLLKSAISGGYGYQGAQARSAPFAQRAEIQKQSLERGMSNDATHAGQAFENDKIMKTFKTTNNNLDRAQGLLNGNAPLTSKSFNALQQDFISALAPGGLATEGKINREMIQTAQGQLNDIKTRFGDVADLRKAQPQIVKNLQDLMNEVRDEYRKGMASQASDIHDSFSGSNNPMVIDTIKKKLQRYAPDEYQKKYGGQAAPAQGLLAPQANPQPQGGATPEAKRINALDVGDWAKQHNVDYPTAVKIMQGRGYVVE